jgi:glycyl-tRNA synthetase beta subunit
MLVTELKKFPGAVTPLMTTQSPVSKTALTASMFASTGTGVFCTALTAQPTQRQKEKTTAAEKKRQAKSFDRIIVRLCPKLNKDWQFPAFMTVPETKAGFSRPAMTSP